MVIADDIFDADTRYNASFGLTAAPERLNAEVVNSRAFSSEVDTGSRKENASK
jgi:hypothetical protein